jgi:hypothetical protein
MQQMQLPAGHRGPIAAGTVLVLVGLGALASDALGFDAGHAIGEGGWPFFVIVPGVALLIAAFAVPPPRGIGLAIAGSIVTTVGMILLYQNATDTWESWAYLWALIPAAAGLGLLVYGSVFSDGQSIRAGIRLGLIGGVLFVIGRWYLGAVLEDGQPPIVIGSAWPILLVIGGVVLAGSAFLRRDEPAPRS